MSQPVYYIWPTSNSGIGIMNIFAIGFQSGSLVLLLAEMQRGVFQRRHNLVCEALAALSATPDWVKKSLSLLSLSETVCAVSSGSGQRHGHISRVQSMPPLSNCEWKVLGRAVSRLAL